ncbi:MAG: NTP transferase domain-containing protein [Acetobacteraceae bacterium]
MTQGPSRPGFPAALVLAGGSGRRLGGVDKSLLDLGGRALLAWIIERLRTEPVGAIALSANGDPARFAAFGLPVLDDGPFAGAGPLAGLLAGLDWAASRGAATLLSVPGDTPFVPAGLVQALAPPPACAAGDGAGVASLVGGTRVRHPGAHGPGAHHAGRRDPVVHDPGGRGLVRHDLIGHEPGRRDACGHNPWEHNPCEHDPGETDPGGQSLTAHYLVALWPVVAREALRAQLAGGGPRKVGAFAARLGMREVAFPTAPAEAFLNVNTAADLAAARTAVQQAALRRAAEG